jgi:hypothetical protein
MRKSALLWFVPCLLVGLAMSCIVASGPAAERVTRKPAAKPAANPMRAWTDATGKFKIRASLVDVEEGQARLRKADGSILKVPVDKLSETGLDREAGGRGARGVRKGDCRGGRLAGLARPEPRRQITRHRPAQRVA